MWLVAVKIDKKKYVRFIPIVIADSYQDIRQQAKVSVLSWLDLFRQALQG